MHASAAPKQTSCCDDGHKGEVAPRPAEHCSCTLQAAPDREPATPAVSPNTGHSAVAILGDVAELIVGALAIADAAEIIPHEQSPPSAVRHPDRGRAPPVA